MFFCRTLTRPNQLWPAPLLPPCGEQRHQKSEPHRAQLHHGAALVHLNAAPCLPEVAVSSGVASCSGRTA